VTTVKTNAQVGYKVVVSDEERANAYVFVKYLVEFGSLKKLYTLIEHGKQPQKRTFSLTTWDLVKKKLDALLKYIDIRKLINSFIDECINKYPFIWFIYNTDVFDKESLLAIICDPPQVTQDPFGKLVSPDAYINVHFIPTKLKNGKHHRSLIAKFFYTKNYLIWFYKINNILKQYPILQSVFNTSYNKYLDKGLKMFNNKKRAESFAKKCARRDCIRVFIGATWLIQIYFLVKHNIVKHVIVPKYLIEHVDMLINPAQLLPNQKKVEFMQKFGIDIEEINWYWLYKLYKQQHS